MEFPFAHIPEPTGDRMKHLEQVAGIVREVPKGDS
jgi:hypothetical protein